MRIEYPGALYHITSRGNGRGLIFLEDTDKAIFLNELADVIKRYNWICHSYCLMSNHYHLLIETIEANLARGMQRLNSIYSTRFNKVHNKIGHLFQGRYKGIIVDRDNYLLELCRYIVLNPVRAVIVDKPEDYFWSSYCATTNLRECPNFLSVDWVLKCFGDQPALARKNTLNLFMLV